LPDPTLVEVLPWQLRGCDGQSQDRAGYQEQDKGEGESLVFLIAHPPGYSQMDRLVLIPAW